MKKIKWTILALLLPTLVQAQGLSVPQRPTGLPGGSDDRVSTVVLNFINLALMAVGIIAVAFLIWGGFRYITSAGNDEVAEGAKKTIQNAIIGLVVIILSYIIVAVVINAFRGRV